MRNDDPHPAADHVVEFEPNTEISLQVPGGVRTTVRLLGDVPDQYIVLRGSGLGGLRFSYGDTVILRYLHAGVVCAFPALVLTMTVAPEHLLFVSYPRADRVRKHPLRSAERLACTLPCRLTHAGVTRAGLVVDLSETGCQCLLRSDAPAADALATATAEAPEVSLQLSVLDEPRQATVAGTVRRNSSGERCLRLGIEFAPRQADLFARMTALLSMAADAQVDHLFDATRAAQGRPHSPSAGAERV